MYIKVKYRIPLPPIVGNTIINILMIKKEKNILLI